MTGGPGEGGTPYLMYGSKKPAMSTPGEKYPVTGGSSLKWLCQHGGLCISSNAVKFDAMHIRAWTRNGKSEMTARLEWWFWETGIVPINFGTKYRRAKW